MSNVFIKLQIMNCHHNMLMQAQTRQHAGYLITNFKKIRGKKML